MSTTLRSHVRHQKPHDHGHLARVSRIKNTTVGMNQLITRIIDGVKSVPKASLANDIEIRSTFPFFTVDGVNSFRRTKLPMKIAP